MLSTLAFFAKYQWWFIGLSFVLLGLAHWVTWRRRSLVHRKQRIILWVSTGLTFASFGYFLYSLGYF
ncbi:hypothetical protein L1765_09290 [Microaerobacter geothermalis]|nr:hypothetical protein [Microaerobacter geothermalis]